MRWRVLGVAQAIVAMGGLGLWTAIRFMRGNIGPGTSDVVAGGFGLVVIGYLVLVFAAAVVLISGRRPHWTGWLELSLVPALLLVAAWAVQDMTAQGGAPEFYYPIIGVGIAGAVICGLAGWRILFASRTLTVAR